MKRSLLFVYKLLIRLVSNKNEVIKSHDLMTRVIYACDSSWIRLYFRNVRIPITSFLQKNYNTDSIIR